MTDARQPAPPAAPLTYLRSASVLRAEPMGDAADALTRITVQFSTGSDVERADYWTGERWVESLEVSESAIDASRIDAGAPFLRDHDPCTDHVIGVTVPGSYRIEGGAAVCDIDLSRDPADAGVIGKIKDKILRNVSVGYRVSEWSIEKNAGAMERRTATRWQPWEISAVAVPADPSAQIRSADGRALEVPMSTQTTIPPAPDAAALRAQVQAELLTRQADIEAAGKAVGADPAAVRSLVADPAVTVEAARGKLIADKIAAQAAEAVRSPVAHITVGTEARDWRRQAIEAAIVVRSGGPLAKTLGDDARGQGEKLRRLTMADLAKYVLSEEGTDTRMMSGAEAVKLAMRAQSSSDFPLILAQVVDKTLLAAYAQQPKEYEKIAAKTTVSNLRTRRPTILSGAVDLEQVPEGADYPMRALLESQETYNVQKRGQIIALTLEAIIKDDLSAFSRIPQAFADAAVRRENAAVFDLLDANAAMADGVALFHATHANLIAAAGAAPSATTLSATDTLIRQQTGANGELLGLAAKYLVVPTGLYHGSAALFSPRYVPTAATGVLAGGIDLLEVVTHPALAATVWYLLADPMRAPVLEYAHPSDVAPLSIEEEDGFSNDTKKYKVRHWFGAGVVDFRGGAKNPGA